MLEKTRDVDGHGRPEEQWKPEGRSTMDNNGQQWTTMDNDGHYGQQETKETVLISYLTQHVC